MTPRPRSFTLLEMLVVAVLLGLLASIGMRSLFTSESSPTHTLRRIAAIDAEARLTARRTGPSRLLIEPDGQEDMTVLTLNIGEQQRRFAFKNEVVLADGLTEIAFDRHGQSVDYIVSVAGSSRVLRIAGLTGWSVIDGE